MKLAHRSHAHFIVPTHSFKPRRTRTNRQTWIRPILDALAPYLLAAAVLLAYHEGILG